MLLRTCVHDHSHGHACKLKFLNIDLGRLDAVADLTAEFVNSTMLYISWNAPYTLKGVPILFYHVKINPFLNTTAENTTLYIPFEQSQVEIIIAITVVPVNRVGEGKATSILTNLATTLEFNDRTGKHMHTKTNCKSLYLNYFQLQIQ